jgi:hypothetical protein
MRPFSFIRVPPLPPTLGVANLDVIASTSAGAYNQTLIFPGTNLGSASSFTVNGSACTISSNTSSSITVSAPAQAAGSYNATITTAGGTSSSTVYFEDTPLFWLSADRATTSGSAVTGIPRSDNGSIDFSLTQTTSGNRPTYSATSSHFNNQPTIVHNGTTSYLTSPFTSSTVTNFTIYAVGMWSTFVGGGCLIDGQTSGNRVCIYDDYTNVGRFDLYCNTTPILTGTTAFSTNTAYVFCFEVNSGVANQQEYSPEAITSGSGSGGGSSMQALTVGTRWDLGAANFLNGAWGTLCAFTGQHNSTTRTRIITRLKTKYGLP